MVPGVGDTGFSPLYPLFLPVFLKVTFNPLPLTGFTTHPRFTRRRLGCSRCQRGSAADPRSCRQRSLHPSFRCGDPALIPCLHDQLQLPHRGYMRIRVQCACHWPAPQTTAHLWWGLTRNPHCMRATTGVQPFAIADQRVVPVLYAGLPAWLRCGMQIARQSADLCRSPTDELATVWPW